jgi:hypothetical protein
MGVMLLPGCSCRAGDTIHAPANAPQQFRNASSHPTRMLCICLPAGQENFFLEVGVPVAIRTTPPPKWDEKAEAEFRSKLLALAQKYRTARLSTCLASILAGTRAISSRISRHPTSSTYPAS